MLNRNSTPSKEDFLAQLKVRLISAPAGIHWARFCKKLARLAGTPDTRDIPNPLVLGGAIASHYVKHDRLREQLDWAESHGCLDAAIRLLEAMDDSKWNIARSINEWHEEPLPPLPFEDFEV